MTTRQLSLAGHRCDIALMSLLLELGSPWVAQICKGLQGYALSYRLSKLPDMCSTLITYCAASATTYLLCSQAGAYWLRHQEAADNGCYRGRQGALHGRHHRGRAHAGWRERVHSVCGHRVLQQAVSSYTHSEHLSCAKCALHECMLLIVQGCGLSWAVYFW